MLSFNTTMASSSSYAETPAATMCLAFPTPPESSLGTLFILDDLLQYLCKCAQTHKSPISKKMNLLYAAIDPTLYGPFSSGEAYPNGNYPFPLKLPMCPTTLDTPTPTILPTSKSPTAWHSTDATRSST